MARPIDRGDSQVGVPMPAPLRGGSQSWAASPKTHVLARTTPTRSAAGSLRRLGRFLRRGLAAWVKANQRHDLYFYDRSSYWDERIDHEDPGR